MTTEEDDFVPISDQIIENKMIATLEIYPKLSYSMLQVGIGTAISPKMWHPILDKLKTQGKIVETLVAARSPMQRDLTHRILSLAPKVEEPNVE